MLLPTTRTRAGKRAGRNETMRRKRNRKAEKRGRARRRNHFVTERRQHIKDTLAAIKGGPKPAAEVAAVEVASSVEQRVGWLQRLVDWAIGRSVRGTK